MCIICIEFNRNKDFIDADRMIEAARREANAISESHLREVEKQLKELKADPNSQGKTLKVDEDEAS